jgi:hypothetical protein
MTTPNQQARDFIAREVKARGETIPGTVLTPPKLKNFGAGDSPVWVVDVAIGSNRELKNVPVKAGANGSRFYAGLGQAVLLKRQAGEKFQVIGPGDRKIGVTEINTYDIGELNPTSTTNQGQQTIRRPYSYYNGGLPGTPNSGLYGTPGYPKIETVDGDGNPI